MNRWLNTVVNNYINKHGKTSNPIIYDVGSRDGKDGVELAQRIYNGINLWQDATIVLFECNPPQAKLIEQAYPQATLITEAISDKKGTVEFMQIHGDQNMVGSSTMNTKRSDNWIQKTTTIKVPTRRLDDVIKQLKHETTEIDILKIDIEGYSYQALQSMGKYLKNAKVLHVETEIEGYAHNKTNLDIELFMRDQGFKLIAIEGEWSPQILDHIYVREEQ